MVYEPKMLNLHPCGVLRGGRTSERSPDRPGPGPGPALEPVPGPGPGPGRTPAPAPLARAEYLRAILHQIPFYIPPVMIANLINIGIFAFMMGFIEVSPLYLIPDFDT